MSGVPGNTLLLESVDVRDIVASSDGGEVGEVHDPRVEHTALNRRGGVEPDGNSGRTALGVFDQVVIGVKAGNRACSSAGVVREQPQTVTVEVELVALDGPPESALAGDSTDGVDHQISIASVYEIEDDPSRIKSHVKPPDVVNNGHSLWFRAQSRSIDAPRSPPAGATWRGRNGCSPPTCAAVVAGSNGWHPCGETPAQE